MKLALVACFLLCQYKVEASLCPPGLPVSLSIAAGNGQLVRGQAYSAPLTVIVTDSCGQPVANTAVTWSASVSSMRWTSTLTDANGNATSQWLAPEILMGFSSWTSGTVTATVPGASVTFFLTAYYLDSRTSIPSVGATVLMPVLGQVLAGNAGGPADGSVQVAVTGQVGGQTGLAVPNVQVSAFSNPTSPSVLQGSALTDANGMATFLPLLSGQPGPVSGFTVDVGGLYQFSQILEFQITGVDLTDAVYVSQLYLDLLSRPADASQSYWLGALADGSMTRASVAADFFGSSEFTANAQFIYDVYQGILARDADFGGWLYWDGQMEAGAASQTAVIDVFLASAEYARDFGVNPDNTAFVSDLYQTALRRAPDAEGLSFWVDGLNSGVVTRAQVAQSFLTVPEFQSRLQNRSSVFLIYFGFLRRDPDAAGESYWLNQLNAGLPLADAINAFITSQEYLARFQ